MPFQWRKRDEVPSRVPFQWRKCNTVPYAALHAVGALFILFAHAPQKELESATEQNVNNNQTKYTTCWETTGSGTSRSAVLSKEHSWQCLQVGSR